MVSIVDSTVASLLGPVKSMSEADTFKQATYDLDRLRWGLKISSHRFYNYNDLPKLKSLYDPIFETLRLSGFHHKVMLLRRLSGMGYGFRVWGFEFRCRVWATGASVFHVPRVYD